MVWPASPSAVHNPDTGVEKETLVNVGKASVEVPSGFVSQDNDITRPPLTSCTDDARQIEASYWS